jgi:uncharacterized repeat protein (TIGR01451 family)
MKLFNKLKRTVGTGVVLGALAAAVLGGAGLVVTGTAHAADCDSNAVVYCGGSTSTLINKCKNSSQAASIRHIWDYFGIGNCASNLTSHDVACTIYRNGNVTVGGEVVATGAITAGRQPMPGSRTVVHQGTRFYVRPPSVSFRSNALSAVCYMNNGVFQYGIMHDCGNPFKATPKKPAYAIKKEVREKGSSTWHTSVTVDPGKHVIYRVKVTSNGAVSAKNINVKDNLPSHVKYVNNTLKRDGNPVSNDSQFFGSGLTISSLAPGHSVVFTFEAIVGPNDTAAKCEKGPFTNKATINSPNLPAESDTANVNEDCKPPKPVFTCNGLTATSTGDLSFNFNAQASASGTNTKITGYKFNFGDGKSASTTTNATTSSVSHTYAQAGTYNAMVTVLVSVNGSAKTVTSSKCQVVVKPSSQPKPPVYACDGLDPPTQVSRTSFNFTAHASASNGASIAAYNYSFGDGKTALNAGSTVNHVYDQPGTYEIVVAAVVNVPGQAQKLAFSEACKTHVTVAPPQVAECTGLTLQVGANRSVTATASYTAGATLTSASFDFGDNTAPVVQASNVASHVYAADGNYLVKATLSFTVEDKTVTGTCQAPVNFNTPEQPAYSCDLLSLTKGEDRMVTISNFQTSAKNGAVFTKADINWGDKTPLTSTDTVIGQTHTFAADGNYTVSATAHFTVMVNGQATDVTASGPNCQQVVSFNATPPPETPPETPPVTPPSTLVNTGAGSVVGLVATAIALGAAAHRRYLRRSLDQN